jgi:hypothetical protein
MIPDTGMMIRGNGMNIIDLIRTTAENQYELMMAMADHIEELEKKIGELSQKPKPRQRGIKPLESKDV